jgi:hypothetical protein
MNQMRELTAEDLAQVEGGSGHGLNNFHFHIHPGHPHAPHHPVPKPPHLGQPGGDPFHPYQNFLAGQMLMQ